MRRVARLCVAAALVCVVVLAIAQLVLPGIATDRIRDQLSHDGDVRSVSVHALPAIELLWHHADRVVIHMGSYTAPQGRLGDSLDRAGDAGSVTATASTVHVGRLTLRDAALTKQGSTLTGTATVTEAALRAAVPLLDSVTPVATGSGGLTLRGTASLFGVRASVEADVAARDGRLVVSPHVPLGGLATLTVFSDPRVAVQGVSAEPVGGGFRLRAVARLR